MWMKTILLHMPFRYSEKCSALIRGTVIREKTAERRFRARQRACPNRDGRENLERQTTHKQQRHRHQTDRQWKCRQPRPLYQVMMTLPLFRIFVLLGQVNQLFASFFVSLKPVVVYLKLLMVLVYLFAVVIHGIAQHPHNAFQATD